MALSSAKHESFYVTSGGGADEVSAKNLTNATNGWAAEKAEGCTKYISDPILGPLIYQLQQMQDEIDYLRTEISANKDKTGITTSQANAITANTAKTSFPGLGTSSTTALAGDTTTISGAQASAITANTAKTSMTLGTSGSTALAGDTKIVGYVGSSDTNITIGNMASATAKGQTTYTLPITVTQSGTDKLGNPTTLTKTATLTLT